jgi:hypothetical protein
MVETESVTDFDTDAGESEIFGTEADNASIPEKLGRGDTQPPKKMLYHCSKCPYQTDKKHHMFRHATRKFSCDIVRDDKWVLEDAQRSYDKILETVFRQLEQLDDINDIDKLLLTYKSLQDKMKSLKNLSAAIPNFDSKDYDELIITIKSAIAKRSSELI